MKLPKETKRELDRQLDTNTVRLELYYRNHDAEYDYRFVTRDIIHLHYRGEEVMLSRGTIVREGIISDGYLDDDVREWGVDAVAWDELLHYGAELSCEELEGRLL